MSREIIFYAEKNKNPDTRIELYWTGADAAQLLFKSLKELSYEQNESYIKVDQAAKEIREAIEDKIKADTNQMNEYTSLMEESRRTLTNISSLEIYHEIMGDIDYYKREIKDLQESIDFYHSVKQTLIAIFNLEFLQTKYDGTPSEWELYVLYSY